MRVILLGLLLIFGSLPLTAQNNLQIPVIISEATLTAAGDLQLAGSLGAGCDVPVVIEQMQEDNTLILYVYQEIGPAQACPRILRPYQDTLDLPDDITRVIVNDIEVQPPESVPQVEQVVLVREAGWSLRVSGTQPDGCTLEIDLTFDDNWLLVDLGECPASDDTGGFEALLPLEIEETTIIERFGQEFELPAVQGVVAGDYLGVLEANIAAVQLENDDDEIPFVLGRRTLIEITDVSVATDSQSATFTISGQEGGCEYPIRTAVDVVGNTVNIDVFRAETNVQQVCQAVMRFFEQTVTVELAPGDYSYTVNDQSGEFSIEEGEVRRVLHNIGNVEVMILESMPPQINLQVTGTIPDGCEGETLVETRREDDRVFVEIYRELPVDVMCPMMVVDYSDTIDLGAFQPGTYIIDVNGFEVEVTV